MRYVLALIIPPLALLLSGRPFQAVFNLLLWVVGLVALLLPMVPGVLPWGIATLWAVLGVHGSRQEARDRRLIAQALRAAGR
jgi:uncharacterized membrane protein YqaE (UPF0057 family)